MPIKPGVRNFLMITIIAILGILLAKVAFNKWPLPGVTDAVNAV